MILVDTSAWLDFFGGSPSKITDRVDQALVTTRASITGLILTELLQGCRSKAEQKLIKDLFEKISIFYESQEIWQKAGDLSLSLKKKGANIKTVDMVIATMAIDQDMPLLTKDKGFQLISKYSCLRLL